MRPKLKVKYNVDKLEVTYTCSESMRNELSEISYDYQTGSVYLVRFSATYYEHNFHVYYAGVYVGELFFGSYNKNRPHIYLQVGNELLYQNINLLYSTEQELNLNLYRLSKIDICLDTNRNVLDAFYALLKDKSITLVVNNKKVCDRKETIANIIHISTGSLNNIRKNKQFCLKCNSFEVKGYNKSLEIQESGKQYIQEALKMKKIYRVEVSFSNFRQIKEDFDLLPIDSKTLYYNLRDQKLLKQIFEKALFRSIHISPNISVLSYLLDEEPVQNSTPTKWFFNIHNISDPYYQIGA